MNSHFQGTPTALTGIDGTAASVITEQQLEENPNLYLQLGVKKLSINQGHLTDGEENTPEKANNWRVNSQCNDGEESKRSYAFSNHKIDLVNEGLAVHRGGFGQRYRSSRKNQQGNRPSLIQ